MLAAPKFLLLLLEVGPSAQVVGDEGGCRHLLFRLCQLPGRVHVCRTTWGKPEFPMSQPHGTTCGAPRTARMIWDDKALSQTGTRC